eukprot:COSAG05_NODE_1093_length_5913_cov_38.151703_1_plen_66_part_00
MGCCGAKLVRAQRSVGTARNRQADREKQAKNRQTDGERADQGVGRGSNMLGGHPGASIGRGDGGR